MKESFPGKNFIDRTSCSRFALTLITFTLPAVQTTTRNMIIAAPLGHQEGEADTDERDLKKRKKERWNS